MKPITLLSCAVLLLMCNSCEKEKEVELKPVLPVFEENFNRTLLGSRWNTYYDQGMGDSVYLENNMAVIAFPSWASPRLELQHGDYNKDDFKLSLQFKLDNVAIATWPVITIATENGTFTNWKLDLRRDSWNFRVGGNGAGTVNAKELKADEWYQVQMSSANFDKQINVIEMSTGESVMSIKLQTSESFQGVWNISCTAFDSPNGNTRKLYIDNFKIY